MYGRQWRGESGSGLVSEWRWDGQYVDDEGERWVMSMAMET